MFVTTTTTKGKAKLSVVESRLKETGSWLLTSGQPPRVTSETKGTRTMYLPA